MGFILFTLIRCNYHGEHVVTGGTLSLNCNDDVHGHFVYIMLRGTNYLVLCEVDVYSQKGTTTITNMYIILVVFAFSN